MILDIVKHPARILTQPAAPIEGLTDQVKGLALDMLETMYHAPGIGLAAPQVGRGVRLFVMDTAKNKKAPMIFINPEITFASKTLSGMVEGCLSLPNIKTWKNRAARITVKYTNLDGDIEERKFSGLQSACVQHEIDHLNGLLIWDDSK